jgi:nitroreductase
MLEAIQFRRSVRSYQEEQLGAEVLNDIIEAGRFAPSGGNNQTTHFLILQNKEALSLLKALVKNAFSKMEPIPGMYKSMRSAIESSKRDTYDFMYNAPTLVVVANKTGYPNSMADSAVALENMMIQATALILCPISSPFCPAVAEPLF